MPSEDVLRCIALERGYQVVGDSLAIAYQDGHHEWRFVAVTLGKAVATPITEMATELVKLENVENFTLSHERS